PSSSVPASSSSPSTLAPSSPTASALLNKRAPGTAPARPRSMVVMPVQLEHAQVLLPSFSLFLLPLLLSPPSLFIAFVLRSLKYMVNALLLALSLSSFLFGLLFSSIGRVSLCRCYSSSGKPNESCFARQPLAFACAR